MDQSQTDSVLTVLKTDGWATSGEPAQCMHMQTCIDILAVKKKIIIKIKKICKRAIFLNPRNKTYMRYYDSCMIYVFVLNHVNTKYECKREHILLQGLCFTI